MVKQTGLFALFVLAAVGCGNAARPREIGVAIDASGSAAPMRDECARMARRIAFTLPPTGKLAVYRYDVRAAEIYDAQRPVSAEEFQPTIRKALEGGAPRGTSQAAAIAALADRAERAEKPFIAILMTDGGDDDPRPQAKARARQQAARLARASKLESVLVCGAVPGSREDLRSMLAPLGAKLRFVEPSRLLEACR